MGYRLTITSEPAHGAWDLELTVDLTRAESNDLFLSGDCIVAWPEEGLYQAGGRGPARTGMFISEVAARPLGLGIRYARRAQAERAAALLRTQLSRAGIKEES